MRIEGYSLQMEAYREAKTEVNSALSASITTQQIEQTKAQELTISDEEKGGSGAIQAEVKQEKLDAFVAKVEQEMIGALLSVLSGKRAETSSAAELELELVETYKESESLEFSTKGIIQADGKEIEVDVNFSLSREFAIEQRLSLSVFGGEEKKEEFVDPLVISLEGSMPKISSDTTFNFDIDSDGQIDQISTLEGQNGFLALDKNENGKIDDGNELFGTKSGNGFKDLNIYDEDKNGWIDENDPIFNKLRVWVKTSTEDRLVALGEVGIGAVYLGHQNTPFTYKDLNGTHAQMRSSGMFLYENGQSGAVSQIDFVKKGGVPVSTPKESVSQSIKEYDNNLSYEDKQVTLSSKNSILEKIKESLEKKIEELETKIKVTTNNREANSYRGEKISLEAQINALQNLSVKLSAA